jgi:hypothetical protein
MFVSDRRQASVGSRDSERIQSNSDLDFAHEHVTSQLCTPERNEFDGKCRPDSGRALLIFGHPSWSLPVEILTSDSFFVGYRLQMRRVVACFEVGLLFVLRARRAHVRSLLWSSGF